LREMINTKKLKETNNLTCFITYFICVFLLLNIYAFQKI